MTANGRDPKLAPADSAGVASAPAQAGPAGQAGHGVADDGTTRMLKMRVFRGDAKDNRMEEYDVPVGPGMVVLDAIHWIQVAIGPYTLFAPCQGRSVAAITGS